jgi:8-oxo-dGTP pyrophosphatase MutT (NUDIX family)
MMSPVFVDTLRGTAGAGAGAGAGGHCDGACVLIMYEAGKNGSEKGIANYKQLMNIFCNNCGQRGHPFRECRDPVLSCGIILLRNRKNPERMCLPVEDINDIEVLMVRRKDSMSFTEFVRGKYDPSRTDYVRNLIENMTKAEIVRLQNEPFDQIWSKMWTDRRDHELIIARDRFEMVKHLLSTTTSVYDEAEWGFPKGRRMRCETDTTCAEREFWEETNIHRKSYIIASGVQLEETFTGTNNVPYQHRYFVGLLAEPFDIHQKFTDMQRREISAIGWKTLSECMDLTRPHYIQRRDILEQLVRIVQLFEVHLPNE